jgi:hypothetical protein
MFERKEAIFVLCTGSTVQETLLNEDQFVQKKNPRINLFFAIAHFMLADSKSHYSGITCAEKKAHVRAAAYEVYTCDVMWLGDVIHMYKLCDWDNDPHVQALCLGYRVFFLELDTVFIDVTRHKSQVVLLCKQEQCMSNVARFQTTGN